MVEGFNKHQSSKDNEPLRVLNNFRQLLPQQHQSKRLQLVADMRLLQYNTALFAGQDTQTDFPGRKFPCLLSLLHSVGLSYILDVCSRRSTHPIIQSLKNETHEKG